MKRLLLCGLVCLLALPAMAQRAKFRAGAGDPTGLCDPLAVYVNYTSGQHFVCTSGSWAVVPAPPAAAAWGSITGTLSSQTDLQTALSGRLLHVPFHSDAGAAATLTNQANAEQFLGNSNRNIVKVDLASYTQARLLVRVVTASASANSPRVYAEYHTAFSTTAGDYATLGTGALNCSLFTGSTYCDTGWINLAAGAKADVWLTVLQNGGDAAADPALGMVALQFK